MNVWLLMLVTVFIFSAVKRAVVDEINNTCRHFDYYVSLYT